MAVAAMAAATEAESMAEAGWATVGAARATAAAGWVDGSDAFQTIHADKSATVHGGL